MVMEQIPEPHCCLHASYIYNFYDETMIDLRNEKNYNTVFWFKLLVKVHWPRRHVLLDNFISDSFTSLAMV